MQRDVEVEFEAVDKTGGFIGAMYLNKTENAAITLVKEGLATVHAYSAEGLAWVKALTDAEAEAKQARKNVSYLQFLHQIWFLADMNVDMGRVH